MLIDRHDSEKAHHKRRSNRFDLNVSVLFDSKRYAPLDIMSSTSSVTYKLSGHSSYCRCLGMSSSSVSIDGSEYSLFMSLRSPRWETWKVSILGMYIRSRKMLLSNLTKMPRKDLKRSFFCAIVCDMYWNTYCSCTNLRKRRGRGLFRTIIYTTFSSHLGWNAICFSASSSGWMLLTRVNEAVRGL